MSHSKIRGSITALVTPFRNGQISEKEFQDLIVWQIEQGTHGLVPAGTTGESATLSFEEHERLLQLAVEAAAGKVPVIAGTGGNATAEAVHLTQVAEKIGADAALVVVPYYNKPTPEGLFQHFKAVHDATNLPIVLYNVPGRTGLNMSDAVIARLAELPRIVALKDATGDLARVATLRRAVGAGFTQLSGEDMTVVGFNAMGGSGCISVTSNVVPAACAAVQEATLTGDYAKALQLHDPLVELHDVMFCETNPVPAKYALSLLRGISPELRLPLVELTDSSKKRVEAVLSGLGLI